MLKVQVSFITNYSLISKQEISKGKDGDKKSKLTMKEIQENIRKNFKSIIKNNEEKTNGMQKFMFSLLEKSKIFSKSLKETKDGKL